MSSSESENEQFETIESSMVKQPKSQPKVIKQTPKLRKDGKVDQRSIASKLTVQKARLAREAKKKKTKEELKNVEEEFDEEDEIVIMKKPRRSAKPKAKEEDKEKSKSNAEDKDELSLLREQLKLLQLQVASQKGNEKKKRTIRKVTTSSQPVYEKKADDELLPGLAERDYLLKMMRGEIIDS